MCFSEGAPKVPAPPPPPPPPPALQLAGNSSGQSGSAEQAGIQTTRRGKGALTIGLAGGSGLNVPGQ